MLFILDLVEPYYQAGQRGKYVRMGGIREDLVAEECLDDTDAAIKCGRDTVVVASIDPGRLLCQDPVWGIGSHETMLLSA